MDQNFCIAACRPFIHICREQLHTAYSYTSCHLSGKKYNPKFPFTFLNRLREGKRGRGRTRGNVCTPHSRNNIQMVAERVGGCFFKCWGITLTFPHTLVLSALSFPPLFLLLFATSSYVETPNTCMRTLAPTSQEMRELPRNTIFDFPKSFERPFSDPHKKHLDIREEEEACPRSILT